MATNGRDVELGISVNATGSQEILDLEKRVRDLGKAGGAAAPEFDALADQINKLGTQTQALEALQKTEDELDALVAAQRRTADTTRELSNSLDELRKASESTAAAEKAARDALAAEQAVLQSNKDAKAQLRIETTALGRTTEETRRQSAGLSTEILKSEQAIRSLAAAHLAAKEAAKAASTEESALQRVFDKSSVSADKLRTDLAGRNAALLESRQAVDAAGVATDNLAASQFKLVTALAAAENEMTRLVELEKQAIAAAKAHAAEEDRLAIIMSNSRREQAAAARAEADGILRDYARMEQAQLSAANAAKAAGQAIDNALRVVGVRGAQDIQAEITKVRSAMDLLKTSGALAGSELNSAFSQGQRRVKELELQLRQATGQLSVMDRAASALKGSFGQFAALVSVVEVTTRLARGFFEANKQIEGLRLGLGTIYKSSATAASQIDFLRATADKAGISVGDISQSFVKFSASMQSANVPIQQTNELFGAVTQSAGVLGLSGDKVSHILDALGQMAAKGTVSMEELRQQLGDSLPGALSLAAKGLGLTDQELVKLVESGGLLARDLFPALTKALGGMGGEVNTLSSTFERFKNVITTTFQVMGDAGIVDALKGALIGLAAALYPVVIGVTTLVSTFGALFRTLGAVAGAITTGNFKELGGTIQEIVDQAVSGQTRLISSYNGLITGTNASTTAQGENAKAFGQVTTAAGAQAVTLQTLSTAATTAAAAQLTAAGAASQSATAASLAGQSWQKLSISYDQAVKNGEAAVLVSEKLAKAKEIEGQTSTAIAQLAGSEASSLSAAAFAALNHATALQTVSDARSKELGSLTAHREALLAEAKVLGDPDGSRAKFIADIDKTIAARSAEAEKAKQSAEASRTDAAAKTLARQAYEDNANAVDALRTAYENSRATLDAYTQLERQGFATKEQLTTATRNAAMAEGLYRDALNDSAAASQRNLQVIKDKNTVANAGLNVDLARAQASEALARAVGDEFGATQAQIAQKQIEIQIRQANIVALKAESAETIRQAEAERAALIASNELTPAKQAEIESRIANAKAKALEAGASAELISKMQAEVSAMLNGTAQRNASSSSRDRHTQSIDKETAALEKQQRVTSDGFATNKDGSAAGTFNNSVPLDKIFALKDKTKFGTGSLTVGDEQLANEALTQAKNAKAYLDSISQMSAGAVSIQASRDTEGALVNAKNAVDRIKTLKAEAAAKPEGGASTSHTVNINLGGRSTSVSVASQQDAQNLTAILRNLESSAGTAS